jgi:hypothetical protein
MTAEEAKTILSTTRVDQLDTDNPDVRAALDLVATTPDLAAWWEAEQAFDRAFARKLSTIDAPRPLQEAILRGGATIFAARQLITETNTDAVNEELVEKNTSSPLDAAKVVPFHQSSAEIAALAGDQPSRRNWTRVLPWSLAASVALGLLGVSLFFQPDKATADTAAQLPAFTQFAEGVVASGQPLEKNSQQLADMQAYFASRQAPDPAALPDPVRADQLVGESVRTWKQDTISLVRLKDPTGTLDLFVLNRADFPHDTVSPTPAETQDGPYTVTTWADDKDIYLLLRKNPAMAP